MKRNEHLCAVESCGNVCPKAYPFCTGCWRAVPKDLKAPVLAELAKKKTIDLDRSALYYAVTAAAASVNESSATSSTTNEWETIWENAGAPELL